MCRSTSDGGRRCAGSSKDRSRALGTAHKGVERARHGLDQARAASDPAAVAAAEAKLAVAQQRLTDTRAAGQPRGHDTAEEAAVPDETTTNAGAGEQEGPQVTSHTLPNGSTFTNVNYAAPGAHVGEQHGVLYGDTSFDQPDTGEVPPEAADAVRRAHEAAARAHLNATRTGVRSNSNTASGNDQIRTQVGFVFGGTFHDHTDQ